MVYVAVLSLYHNKQITYVVCLLTMSMNEHYYILWIIYFTKAGSLK